MAVTLGSSGITFSDSTSQTSAGKADRASGDLIDIQSFGASGTWVNPGATMVHVKLIGGGGGALATVSLVVPAASLKVFMMCPQLELFRSPLVGEEVTLYTMPRPATGEQPALVDT